MNSSLHVANGRLAALEAPRVLDGNHIHVRGICPHRLPPAVVCITRQEHEVMRNLFNAGYQDGSSLLARSNDSLTFADAANGGTGMAVLKDAFSVLLINSTDAAAHATLAG